MSSRSCLELRARAKLNLFLEVCGRRPDGYHEIDSVFAEVDLADRVILEKADRLSLEVEGDAPDGATNLAWRAAEALGVPARIRLVKEIPSGAGMGGGSSDAAAVLRGLDRLYALETPPEKLASLASSLGADVPFFLRGGLARCRGIGDRVEPLEPVAARFLVVAPAIPLSTVEVYRALDAGLTGSLKLAMVFLGIYQRTGGPEHAPYWNRLQEAAERLVPELRRVRLEAQDRFGTAFAMTGSGSAYFGVLQERAAQTVSTTELGGVPVRIFRVRAVRRDKDG